jgi:hypothetical protein
MEVAEIKPTYEKWYEWQCDIGYDVDEEWIHQEADHALADILQKAGMPNCMWRNNYGGVNWSVGGYDDYVTFDLWVELHKIPKDHKLRVEYPFAFLADEKDFAFEHEITWSRNVRRANSLEWNFNMNTEYDSDEALEEGTIYDGMNWQDAYQLMDDQTEGLMEVLKQYADDACYLAMCSIRADYDWFFSEERYNEEIE